MENQTTLKVQRRKVGTSGLLQNQLMGNNATVPVVGKGATQLHHSDRTCYEVIEVSEDGKTCRLQKLKAEWNKELEGGYGHQNWNLIPIENYITLVWRNNAWRILRKEIVFTNEYEDEYRK